MIKISQPIVVEGRYDKIKISSLVDATIIETGGFQIFRDKELLQTLRTLAKKTGLIILTDSDEAGFKIRRYITGSIKDGKITNVYIPELAGKEKRKIQPSAAGLLGVEGVSKEVILKAFEVAGITTSITDNINPITKIDLFEVGLNGKPDSRLKREIVLKKLGLPGRISANSMVTIVNSLLSKEDFYKLVEDIF